MFQKESTRHSKPPEEKIPIDILSVTKDHIMTGIPCGKQEKQPKETADIENFPSRLRRLPLEWTVSLLMEENDIDQQLSSQTTFEIASDGGYDPLSGISSFGWVISMNRSLLAKGRGPAESHPDLAESFRSEGYGLESVSRFIIEMVDHFKISPDDHTWKFYIDNKAMIDRMDSYTSAINNAQWNLRSDADITNQAYDNLSRIPASYIHVKSHQDNKDTDLEKLPFNAQMNIMADALATQQREMMKRPVTIANTKFCHLVIKDKYITRDTKKQIIQEAGKILSQNYYHRKYGWSKTTFNSIHWETQLKALRFFKSGDQRRILKFAHDWLPTNARLFRESQESTPACRLCGYLEERSDHMLICNHSEQVKTRKKWEDYLNRDSKNHGNTHINAIIKLALKHCASNKHWQPDIRNLPNEIQSCIKQQNKIGWYHLFKGRIAKDMICFMETHYRNANLDSKRYTGERWGKMLLINIWSTMLELWSNRNKVIHGIKQRQEQTTEKQRLESRVRNLYEKAHLLKSQDRNKIFYKNVDEMVLEDARFLKAWINMAQRLVVTAKKEAKQPRNAQRMMENYFSWSQNKKKQPRLANAPRSSAVQHPD
jgi:hypothetical protein